MAMSTHTYDLLLPPDVPNLTKKAHLLPNFPSVAVISVGTLCNEGCTAHFDATNLIVIRRGSIILTGTRTTATGLWIVDC